LRPRVRQVRGLPFRIRREWTAPKLGAVSVTNTRGRVATSAGTPLPPESPAATSCQASPRYVSAHDGQAVARRFPHATRRAPPEALLVSSERVTSPVAGSAWSIGARDRGGMAELGPWRRVLCGAGDSL